MFERFARCIEQHLLPALDFGEVLEEEREHVGGLDERIDAAGAGRLAGPHRVEFAEQRLQLADALLLVVIVQTVRTVQDCRRETENSAHEE